MAGFVHLPVGVGPNAKSTCGQWSRLSPSCREAQNTTCLHMLKDIDFRSAIRFLHRESKKRKSKQLSRGLPAGQLPSKIIKTPAGSPSNRTWLSTNCKCFLNDFHVKREFLIFQLDLLTKNENVAKTNCAMFKFNGNPAALLMVLRQIVQQTNRWTITGKLNYPPAACLTFIVILHGF